MAATIGSDHDTTLYVGRLVGNKLEQVGCDDDTAGSGQSVVRFTAEAGATYYIMAASFSPTAGGAHLVVSLEPAPPPIEISLSIDGATFDDDGVLTIHGEASCSERASNVYLSGEVAQRVGRLVFRGYSDAEMSRCGRRARPWVMHVVSHDGTFGEEVARVTASASVCHMYDCAYADAAADLYPVPETAPVTPSPVPSEEIESGGG